MNDENGGIRKVVEKRSLRSVSRYGSEGKEKINS